jgi:hypothetical protein
MKTLGVALRALLLLAICECVCATSIVAVRMPDGRIVMAADSGIVGGAGNQRAISQCKISTFGDVLFASAGLYHPAGVSDFNIGRIAQAVFGSSAMFTDKLANFEKQVVAELTVIVNDEASIKSDRMLRERVNNNGSIVEAIVIHANAGSMIALRVFYAQHVNGTAKILVTAGECPGNMCTGEKPYVVGIGQTALALPYVKNHTSVSLPVAIEDAIKAEIDANPTTVAPPIDIVQLSGGHLAWIKQKTNCQNTP